MIKPTVELNCPGVNGQRIKAPSQDIERLRRLTLLEKRRQARFRLYALIVVAIYVFVDELSGLVKVE